MATSLKHKQRSQVSSHSKFIPVAMFVNHAMRKEYLKSLNQYVKDSKEAKEVKSE